MARGSKFSQEVRDRAVRMVFDPQEQYASQWATIRSISEKIGSSPEALRRFAKRKWSRDAVAD